MPEPFVYAAIGPQNGGYELTVRLEYLTDYSQSPYRSYSEYVLSDLWDDIEDNGQMGGTHIGDPVLEDNVTNVFYTIEEAEGLHLYHIGLATRSHILT